MDAVTVPLPLGPGPIGAVVNTTQVTKLLNELGAQVEDLRPVFRGKVAPAIAADLRRQFESRGAHLGTPWKPLSLVTIRLRTRVVRRRGGGLATTSRPGQGRYGFSTPMRNTGRLFQSLTKHVDAEGIRVYERLRMAWGTRVAYAEPHHRPGGFTTRVFGQGELRQVPPRPVIPAEMPPSVLGAYEALILGHLTGGA